MALNFTGVFYNVKAVIRCKLAHFIDNGVEQCCLTRTCFPTDDDVASFLDMLYQKVILFLSHSSAFHIAFHLKDGSRRTADKEHRVFSSSWWKNPFNTDFPVRKNTFNNRVIRIDCNSQYCGRSIDNAGRCSIIEVNTGELLTHAHAFNNQLSANSDSNVGNTFVFNVGDDQFHIIFQVTEPFVLFNLLLEPVNRSHQLPPVVLRW